MGSEHFALVDDVDALGFFAFTYAHQGNHVEVSSPIFDLEFLSHAYKAYKLS